MSLQDANGRQITVGCLVRAADPAALHGLCTIPQRVKEIAGRVAILDFDPTRYDEKANPRTGKRRVIETGSNAYAGFALVVVKEEP